MKHIHKVMFILFLIILILLVLLVRGLYISVSTVKRMCLYVYILFCSSFDQIIIVSCLSSVLLSFPFIKKLKEF